MRKSTSKEVYGHDIQFEDDNNPDRAVWWVTLFVLGFICGMLLT